MATSCWNHTFHQKFLSKECGQVGGSSPLYIIVIVIVLLKLILIASYIYSYIIQVSLILSCIVHEIQLATKGSTTILKYYVYSYSYVASIHLKL